VFEEEITDLAQQIYVTRKNRKNNVTGTRLTVFLETTIIQVNLYLTELDKEAYWNWVRTNDFVLAEATSATSYPLDPIYRTIVKDENRPLYIVKDGQVVSVWDVVNPSQLKNAGQDDNPNRVALIARNVKFSRALTEQEIGGDIVVDVVEYLPKISMDNIDVLSLVDPANLIVLGVAKNQVLPDVVQGGLTPSFTQKYADLLNGAKAENEMTSTASAAIAENLSGIRGVGF
jgi:hypothetical protein